MVIEWHGASSSNIEFVITELFVYKRITLLSLLHMYHEHPVYISICTLYKYI